MRAAMFSLIWLGCIALAEAQTAAPTPTASLSPKNVVEAVADPSKAESQNFDIEYVSRSFAFSIDRLSVQLSQTLGPWSKYNLFLQITPAKIILGILSALIALAILQVVRLLLLGWWNPARVAQRRRNFLLGNSRFPFPLAIASPYRNRPAKRGGLPRCQ
jgi:hypothetical protein